MKRAFSSLWSFPVLATSGTTLAVASFCYWHHVDHQNPSASLLSLLSSNSSSSSSLSSSSSQLNQLDPYYYRPFVIQHKERLAPNIIRLTLQARNLSQFKDPIARGGHLYVMDDSIQIIRPYTPILLNDLHSIASTATSGSCSPTTFQLAVKIYSQGHMAQFLNQKNVGDVLALRGPVDAPHSFTSWESHEALTMVAGGTGVLPFLNLIPFLLKQPPTELVPKRRIQLLYGSKRPDEILFMNELLSLEKSFPGQFSVTFFVETDPSTYWNETQNAKELPAQFIQGNFSSKGIIAPRIHENDTVVLCGPERMVHSLLKGDLLGHHRVITLKEF